MCWKQNAFNPKLSSSPSGQKEGHLEGPWGTFLLQLRKLSHQLARNGRVQPSPGAPCIRPRWLFLSEQKGLVAKLGRADRTKKESDSSFCSSSLEVPKITARRTFNHTQASRMTCQMHRAADSLGQEFKYQLSSESPGRVVRPCSDLRRL